MMPEFLQHPALWKAVLIAFTPVAVLGVVFMIHDYYKHRNDR